MTNSYRLLYTFCDEEIKIYSFYMAESYLAQEAEK